MAMLEFLAPQRRLYSGLGTTFTLYSGLGTTFTLYSGLGMALYSDQLSLQHAFAAEFYVGSKDYFPRKMQTIFHDAMKA